MSIIAHRRLGRGRVPSTPTGLIMMFIDVAYTQTGVFNGHEASTVNMTDGNQLNGAYTDPPPPFYISHITAILPVRRFIHYIEVADGNLSGSINYLINGALIETSEDLATWSSLRIVQGVNGGILSFAVNRFARAVRLTRNGNYLATTEFRLWGQSLV